MKRTVREESGAWSLLKNAAVRARATARSFALTMLPKFPVAMAGADGLRYTASGLPTRSTTAMIMVSSLAAWAAACTRLLTSDMARAGPGPGGGSGYATVPEGEPAGGSLPPLLQPASASALASPIKKAQRARVGER